MDQVKKVVRLDENPMGNEEQVKVYDGGDERDGNEISDMAYSQEPSSSKRNQKRDTNAIDNCQINKKLKKTEAENQQKIESEQASFKDLPPEMLMEILKYLDTKDLFAYRLLNRIWNGVATEILQSRTDFEVKFGYVQDTKSYKLLGKEKEDGMTLLHFISCFHASKNFPYTRFWFNRVDCLTLFNALFNDCLTHWNRFISDFKEQVKCLILSISQVHQNYVLTLLTKKVSDLLLIQLPNLEEFGLDFSDLETLNASTIKLFSTSKESKPEAVKLPHLKVLHLDDSIFSNCTGIIMDLFLAAINLEKIQPYNKSETYNILDSFYLLQSLGKLDCLKSAKIVSSTDEFLFQIAEICTVPLDFKLNYLTMDLKADHEQADVVTPETKMFISKLFESCKDSLKELTTDSLRFLNDVKFPRFSKLTNIKCQGYDWIFSEISKPFLSSGINSMEIFPFLESLDLQMPWRVTFPEEGDKIPCIPTVKTVRISGGPVDERSIAQISKLCPNLKNLEISLQQDLKEYYDVERLDNFPEVGRAIWTHLTKLKTLKLHVFSDGLDFPAVDSCITGLSTQYCKSLCHLLVADKLWRKIEPRRNIPESEMKAHRKYPSILDLKELESFDFHMLYLHDDIEIQLDLTREGPTWISQECAFDLMKNLSCKVLKEAKYFDPENEWDEDDRLDYEESEETWRF